jgi:hypothetical protein
MVKLDSSGNTIWSFGLTNNMCCQPYITIRNIYVDDGGGVTAVGDVVESVSLGVFPPTSDYAMFFAKFLPNGTNTAAKLFTNLLNQQSPGAKTATGFVVGGSFNNMVTYEGVSFSASAYSDVAIFNIDADGAPLWARKLIGNLDDSVDGIATTTDGTIVASGNMNSSSISGAGLTIGGMGERTIYLMALDQTGAGKWSKAVGTTMNNAIWSSAITYSTVDGHLYWAGDFSGSLGLAGGSITSSDRDVFVAKISGTGVVEWVRSIGGTGDQMARSVVTDGAGNVYVGGFFASQLRAGTNTFTSHGGNDLFIVKYSNSGNLLWAKQIGSAGSDMDISLGFSRLGELLVAGSIGGGLSLEGTYIEGGGITDAFVAKFAAEGDIPKFLTSPQSRVASAGTTVVLSGDVAPNSATPSFQWWFNGSKLQKETNATLTLPNFQAANAGSYYVVAANAAGQVQSDVAAISFTDASTLVLTVHPSLTIYGTIGKTYRIDYSDALESPVSWQSSGNLTVTTSPQIWVDTNAAVNEKRVYRVILQ